MQIVDSALNREWCKCLEWAAFEKSVPCSRVEMFLNFEVKDFDEWISVFFKGMRQYSRYAVWSEITRRYFVKCLDSGVKFWMQVETTESVRCGEVD